MSKFRMLDIRPQKALGIGLVQLIALCCLIGQSAFSEVLDHDPSNPSGAQLYGGQNRFKTPSAGTAGRRSPCRVNPMDLNEFANGETYHYSALVSYLSNPVCEQIGDRIAKKAVEMGVTWKDKAPWRLDLYVNPTLKGDLKGRDLADAKLAERTPVLLGQNPMGSEELLPLIGQLSLLSPSAGRTGLVNLAQQQLFTADELLRMKGVDDRTNAIRISKALTRLGLDKAPIAGAFASSVEDMALLSQADSLNKVFRSLGAAASVDGSLVPTFNLSAGALNRGIQKGNKLYSQSAKEGLMQSVFIALRAANAGNERFEPAMAELNEAMGPLLKGFPLMATNLKQTWSETLGILADNASQPVLADAVGLSLTPELVFLSAPNRVALLMASRNYRQISVAIQANILEAWNRMKTNRGKKRLSLPRFRAMTNKNLKPWVSDVLELDPTHLTRNFMMAVLEEKLIDDTDLETRFPLFVVAHLQRAGQASGTTPNSDDMAATTASLATQFQSLWTLSNVHIPALWDWVERYDQKNQDEEAQASGPAETEVAYSK